jgi:hypothetical protein
MAHQVGRVEVKVPSPWKDRRISDHWWHCTAIAGHYMCTTAEHRAASRGATVGIARVLVIICAARRFERSVSSVVVTRNRAAIKMPAASKDPPHVPEL